jgi:prepilin-type N-terminal cleavage/methylation domain-containing protein
MSKGFTLIEVIVSLGIFSLVLLITSGIFTAFVTSQRRNIGEQEVQENLRFSLELISREIRTGYASSFALLPANPSADQGPTLVFRDQNGACVAHRREGGAWVRAVATTSNECDLVNYSSFAPLTSRETTIADLHFKIPTDIASSSGLSRQGFITINSTLSSASASIPPLSLQTTISSRQIRPYGS